MDWGNTRGGKTDRGKGLIWTVSVTNNTAHISFCGGGWRRGSVLSLRKSTAGCWKFDAAGGRVKKRRGRN